MLRITALALLLGIADAAITADEVTELPGWCACYRIYASGSARFGRFEPRFGMVRAVNINLMASFRIF
eukprot:SAG11_NODE_719_length_7564_cov_14.939317_8_plen_68_part_00